MYDAQINFIEEKAMFQSKLDAYDDVQKLEKQDLLDKMANLSFENEKTKSCLEKEESKNEEMRKEVSTLEAKVAEELRERETLHESWKSTLGKVIKNNNDKLKVGWIPRSDRFVKCTPGYFEPKMIKVNLITFLHHVTL